MHAARCKYRTEKIAKKSPSGHHRATLSGYIFATKACIDKREKLVKQQYVFHMIPQYRELRRITAETGWRVWGTSANVNGVRVLTSLLQRRRSAEVNETLHGV